jgi:hypothetical protein
MWQPTRSVPPACEATTIGGRARPGCPFDARIGWDRRRSARIARARPQTSEATDRPCSSDDPPPPPASNLAICKQEVAGSIPAGSTRETACKSVVFAAVRWVPVAGRNRSLSAVGPLVGSIADAHRCRSADYACAAPGAMVPRGSSLRVALLARSPTSTRSRARSRQLSRQRPSRCSSPSTRPARLWPPAPTAIVATADRGRVAVWLRERPARSKRTNGATGGR